MRARKKTVCKHATLRARDYDMDARRWKIECTACGHVKRLTGAEWRQHLVADVPGDALIDVEHGVESGRLALV